VNVASHGAWSVRPSSSSCLTRPAPAAEDGWPEPRAGQNWISHVISYTILHLKNTMAPPAVPRAAK
jgi:hypothetical protein